MSVFAATVAVDHTGEKLVAAALDAQSGAVRGQNVKLANRGASSAWLGPANVTDSAGAHVGYELKTGEVSDWFELPPGDEIYAMCLTGQTTTVGVLAVSA